MSYSKEKQKPNKLTAVSLFSGCGGFDWGAVQAGIKIIWANDINKYAAQAYKTILPRVPFNFGDVREYKTFPHADILIGCYPCTGFSIAARRRWKDLKSRDLTKTEGNFLYLEFMRVLEKIKPKYFFVENVSGMVSAIDGWFFQQQLEGFRAHGYQPQYKLLRAIDYGVPQDRKRIFIVGVRNDIAQNFTYKFPEPTHGHNTKKSFVTMADVLRGLDPWPAGEFSTQDFHGHYLTRNRKRSWNEPSYTIVANESHVPLHPMGKPMINLEKDRWVLQGKKNRRLSWKECRILQCLPEQLNPDGNLASKYLVIGNAVPPVFAKILLTPVVKHEKKFIVLIKNKK
jgi:DNA (cytosine-5)-methyltransferase 1